MKRTLLLIAIVLFAAAIVTLASLAVTLQTAEAGKGWCRPC